MASRFARHDHARELELLRQKHAEAELGGGPDMHHVMRRVVDDGQFFEVHRGCADNLLMGFARGLAVGRWG